MPSRASGTRHNQILDEVLADQEGDFYDDDRWALEFEQHGFAESDCGDAEILSKAKNMRVAGMVAAGILGSRAGQVRLLRPGELPEYRDPEGDTRLPAWEMVHHLARPLEVRARQRPAEALACNGLGRAT